MQRQSNHLYIKVQTCCNCHLHSWCTRHDQSKYNAFYQKFQTMIKAHFPKAVISRNQPPPHYQRVYDSPEGPDRYIDENNYEVSYPRSGAFQISVNGVQIFSKLKSSLWPSIERVVKLIMNIEKDVKQKEDIQKYSLQYRLQNDHDFSFVQTYRAELKRKQMVKINTLDKPISSGGNRSFKSRRLFSNSKTKKKSTEPEQSSPIINSRKFQGSHLIKLNQNLHQISDFNDEEQDREIYKWKLKESHKKQQQNLIKKTPLFINKSKVMQKLKNKSGILKDNKAKEDQINLHRLIDENLEEEEQSKNSSKLNTKKIEEKKENKNEDSSGGKLKGWSDKEQKSKSDFVINETSNSLKDNKEEIETKKKPSINQKLQENQEEDYQFILEQSGGQQKIGKKGKSQKEQQKIYLKPKEQDQKSYAESNDKKSLQIEQTFSQKSLDIKKYYQIYEKIANWEAVYTESQEDYEVYQFTLLLMSKNFESQPSDKHEIESFQQFEEQNLDVFRVKQAEVKQIKYKQLVYNKYAQVNWNAKYKNGFKLAREGEEELQSFCEEIMDDNQIEDEVKIQQAKKIQQNIQKNKQRKQKQQKLAAQLKLFNQAVNLKIQTAYLQGQNWVALYQNKNFLLNKESKTKKNQSKEEKPILKSPVINIQSFEQQKWVCEYSNNQFTLQKKIDKTKVDKNQSEEKLIKKEIKVETKQIKIHLEDCPEEKWTAEYSNNGFQLKKRDKPKLSTQNTDKTKIQVKVQNKNMANKNQFKTAIKQQLLNIQQYQQEKWVGEYQNEKYKLQRRNNLLKPEVKQKISGQKEIEIKKQAIVENKKEEKVSTKKEVGSHTALQGYNQQKWVAQYSNGDFLLYKKQNKEKLAVKAPVEIRNNQAKAESMNEKKLKNSQQPQLKKETQIKEVDKSVNWLAQYSEGRFQLFKKEEKQNKDALTDKKEEIKTKNQKDHNEIKELNKANTEQVSSKKMQIKQQSKKQSIQIPKEKAKEKANQIKKETVSEAHKIQNQNEKKQGEKNKQPRTAIANESMLWIAQYKGIEFILKKDQNISNVPKTGDQKKSITTKNENEPKQQEKASKINKNEEKDPNIICWTGKYKNNQFMLQKIIQV